MPCELLEQACDCSHVDGFSADITIQGQVPHLAAFRYARFQVTLERLLPQKEMELVCHDERHPPHYRGIAYLKADREKGVSGRSLEKEVHIKLENQRIERWEFLFLAYQKYKFSFPLLTWHLIVSHSVMASGGHIFFLDALGPSHSWHLVFTLPLESRSPGLALSRHRGVPGHLPSKETLHSS